MDKIGDKLAVIEGKVVFYRSKKKSRCICCKDGAHVYCRGLKVEVRKSLVHQGLEMKSVNDFLNECLHLMPDIEGKRVKITFEVQD